MMRTTADASKTSLEALLATISALTILANQFLRAGMKNRFACLNGERLEIGEGLTATLAGISAADLLQATERLLAQTAPMLARPELHHLMERIGKIPDLKRCHPRRLQMKR